MEELTILKFQAEQIQNTLRLVANVLKSHTKETCLDRDIIQCKGMIDNVLAGNPNQRVTR